MKHLLQNLSIKTKIGLIILLPMCGYLVTSGINLVTTYAKVRSDKNIITMVEFSGQISLLVHELQKERGASSGFLASKGTKFEVILDNQRTATDEKSANYRKSLTTLQEQAAGATLAVKTRQVETILKELDRTRQKVSSQQMETKEVIHYYTALIKTLLDTISATSHLSDNPGITTQLFAYVNFLQGKERAGIERATLSAVFSKGSFTTETYSRFLQLLAAQENYLDAFRAESTVEAMRIYNETVRGNDVDEVARMRQVALNVGLDNTKTFGIDPEIWFKTITNKINLLKSVDDTLAQNIIQSAILQVKTMQRKLTIIGVSFVAILAASIMLVITTSLSLIRGLNQAIHVALDLAEGEGDLTKRMGFTAKDEIGVLGRSIDKLLTTLGGMISQIQNNGVTLNHSGQELAALAEQMSGATSNIQSRANGVAAAAEEMSINMNTVAAAVEEAAVNVSTVAESTGTIAAAGKEIAGSTKNARTMTNEAVVRTRSSYELISVLGDAAQEIGRVTETITEISEQTNLLALNATIEAARAGDAGKGFAVVANEIKELAKQTAMATIEINTRIKGIQDSTGKTVDEIQEILRVINEVNTIVDSIASAVENQTSTTNDIAENIEQASTGLQEVASNVSQISMVSGEVAKDIAEVSHSSLELTESSTMVRKSAANLSEMTAKMQEVTGRFKV
ncbi:methyl-accepting chemotaxis protein [Desulforhopalus sp. IMCC35007]|uniref:methyl-accepting chemotaxis protein n=1 Tax=Desulforhopalus sp. IMCC35007 TaxID=2569543 RepID=UPI00145FCE93|nr:methyl-accepting chemotaxis protein [Desulforhopalus sp. IMCC35007]